MPQQTDQFDNPYAAPQSLPAMIPVAAFGDSSADAVEQELRAFVGPRADYYLQRWTPLLRGTRVSGGLNWPAFLFSGIWLPYRKMFAATLIFYGAMMAVSLLEELYFEVVLHEDTPAGLDRALSLVAAVICGMFANRWYLSRAKRVIAAARASGYQGDALLQTVAQRGGTSLLAGFGMFALFVAANSVIYSVLDAVLSAGGDVSP